MAFHLGQGLRHVPKDWGFSSLGEVLCACFFSQLSTYALTLFRKVVEINDRQVSVGESRDAERPRLTPSDSRESENLAGAMEKPARCVALSGRTRAACECSEEEEEEEEDDPRDDHQSRRPCVSLAAPSCLKGLDSDVDSLSLRSRRADIWDTAGQERFNKMHPAYYHRAHATIAAPLPLLRFCYESRFGLGVRASRAETRGELSESRFGERKNA